MAGPDLDKRLNQVDDELKLLKNEIKQVLLEIQEHVLSVENPFISMAATANVKKRDAARTEVVTNTAAPVGAVSEPANAPPSVEPQPTPPPPVQQPTPPPVQQPPMQPDFGFGPGVSPYSQQMQPSVAQMPVSDPRSMRPGGYGPSASDDFASFDSSGDDSEVDEGGKEEERQRKFKQFLRRRENDRTKKKDKGRVKDEIEIDDFDEDEAEELEEMQALEDGDEKTENIKVEDKKVEPKIFKHFDLLTVAGFATWTRRVIAKIGRENLEPLLEISEVRGKMDRETKELVLALAHIYDDRSSNSDVAAKDLVSLLAQLDVLAGKEPEQADSRLLPFLIDGELGGFPLIRQ